MLMLAIIPAAISLAILYMVLYRTGPVTTQAEREKVAANSKDWMTE